MSSQKFASGWLKVETDAAEETVKKWSPGMRREMELETGRKPRKSKEEPIESTLASSKKRQPVEA